MTDDGHAPTVPDTQAPTHAGARTSLRGAPVAPDARYEMRELIGRGGMGEVWLAHDGRIHRDVAIKLMRGDGTHDDDAVARFLREARVQGQLEHPAIVPVHDVGLGESPYFVMKRLAGTTLADVLVAQAKGDRDALERWPRRTLLARFVDVCLAIELAHRRGVIHRDLKPANIMLGDLGETYVLDWGLARVADSSDRGAIRTSDLAPADSSSGQTVAGAMLGTPGYMSPEQMRGEAVDHRTDVYALGCILHEIVLAGTPAIPRDKALEATLTTESHRPSRARPDADVPPELDDACARATTAAAAARLGSARALADEVQRFLDGDRDLARRRELASEHARAAVDRFTREGDAGRAAAMTDAGRSLALDPTNADAQQLLARLLLEPPREMPPEAARRIEQDRAVATQGLLRRGAAAYGWNLALVPIVKLLGVSGIWPFAVVSALLVALIATMLIMSRRPRVLGSMLVTSVLVVHGLMLAFVAMCFGPLLFAPIFAFGSLPIALLIPAFDAPKRTLAVHLLPIVVPLALEWLHVVPATFYTSGKALVVEPWAITASPQVVVGILLAIIVLQMIANTAIINNQRRVQERAQEQLHVHSWHLAQLVPATRSRTP